MTFSITTKAIVEELEALLNKHGYSVPDFIDAVHSLHNVKTAAKTPRSVSVKTIEALGFTRYADYLADLMKKKKWLTSMH